MHEEGDDGNPNVEVGVTGVVGEQKDDDDIEVMAKNEFSRPEFKELFSSPPPPIIIRDLTVLRHGKEVDATSLSLAPNFATALLGPWLANLLRLGGKTPTSRQEGTTMSPHVVSGIHAILLPGEMTLLLGPSSSGKTTLMQTVFGKLKGTLDKDACEGSVVRVGSSKSSATMKASRSAAFCDQGDLSLAPILTVHETVRFARACAENLDNELLEDSLQTYLKLTGLHHVQSTVVGDADIRGISGGQKRRVKMLEMAVGIDATTFLLDEITNGLDAASAYSICQVTKTALRETHSTAILSLLQPSEQVLSLFDRVILLTQDGRLAYSGTTKGAVSHFESLGLVKPAAMNRAEFLLRCATAPQELVSGGDAEAPETTLIHDAAKEFSDSPAHQELVREMEGIEADAATSSTPPMKETAQFATSTYKQISLLIGRGWKLVLRNPASIMRVVSAMIFGVFVATLFLNTSSDAEGTQIRSGYVLTLLFLSFLNSCMAPLDDLFRDRLTFYIHRRASFYSTASYYFANAVTSAPVALLETFFLSVLTFFAVGMNHHSGAWGFFYFWAILSLVTLSGTAVARCLAYSLPTNDMASTLGSAALLLFIISAGNSPQYNQLPSWLKWLAWISPCAYCYEGILVNELYGRTVEGLPGRVFGQQVLGVPRIDYDDAPPGLDTEGTLMAFDVYMLILLIFFYEVIACVLLHHSQKWYGPTTKRYQVSCGMSLSAPPESRNNKNKSVASNLQESTETVIPAAPPVHLTASKIVYEVDVEPEAEPPTTAKEFTDAAVPKNSFDEFGDDEDSSIGPPTTAREYGQTGKGAAQEWLIKRRLGEEALGNLSSRSSSAWHQSERGDDALDPPQTGRLRLLSGITASFEPRTLTALMGSSGAGKSTLLDVLAGYKTGGHILGDVKINGQPKSDAVWRSIAGYCEQVDLHNPAMTVLESLVFAARMRLRPFAEIADKAKLQFAQEILELLELDEFADMLVGDEASGEGLPKHARKRLTVGVELAGNPSILFADEPTSGLDSLSASVVVSSLERAAKKQGLTVVCTIHQPSREVFEAFDNLVVLKKGGVVVYNGRVASLASYIQSAPDGAKYAMPQDVNPADHILEVFAGPLGEDQDWNQFYMASDMASEATSKFETSSEVGTISVDTTSQSFVSEFYIVLQRQLLSHWRTPTYMAVRFLWTVVANVLVGLLYFQNGGTKSDAGISNVVGALFFYVNIATVPLLSAIVPLISERAVFYRETTSGTYRRVVYGMAVQLAELPFNLGAGLLSFVIFYFMVGLDKDAERVMYFILMSLACYWVLPTFGQLFAFLSPNIGAAVGLGSLLLTLMTLTMGFLIPANKIPPWYIWIYWINPLRYLLQGMVANEVGGDGGVGDELLAGINWSFDDRWWYCFVALIMFGAAASVGILLATRVSWLKR